MNQAKQIQGSRIEQARKISGYTQKQLAEKVGVHQSAIAQYESGRATPSTDVVEKIAEWTRFLPAFFELAPLDDFSKGSLSYRALRSLTAKEEDKAYWNAKLMYEHVSAMSMSFVLPQVKVPILREKPERAARITRAALGTSPNLPIKNVTNLLEKNGVVILALPLFLKKIDAFSTWVELQGERPMIAESFGKQGDRLRFSLAHELGHLVLHHPPKANVKAMEKEANEFASAFLLPRDGTLGEFTKPVTLLSVAQMKVKWGVSMQALILRARDLKVLTPRQTTYLISQMSSRGWRTREPSNLDVKIETPQLFSKMVEGIYDNPGKYAAAMGLSEERASELTLFA